MTLHAAHAAEITPDAQRRLANDAQRRTMIDSQLRTVGVNDAHILAAFAATPRERFVPSHLAGLAYADAALEIAPGRWLLEPLVLALLLQHARIAPTDRVLVVGAATGYSAAVILGLGARVTALESDPDLLAQARAAGVDRAAGLEMTEGPLPAGAPAGAPFDVILFEGAIETLPAALVAQLAPGGRIAAVVRENARGRAIVGAPLPDGRIAGLPFLEVAAKPLPGFAAPREFAF